MATQQQPEPVSLDDVIQQFRVAAAEVQSAYHQLEQELLMPASDTWDPEPVPTGLALPNLAPLYLMGTLVSGLSKASMVVNQDLETISANADAQREFALEEGAALKDILDPGSVETLQQLLDQAASKSAVELKVKAGASAGIYDCIYLDNPIEKGRMLLLVAQDLELDHLREVEDRILKNLTGTLVHEIRTPLTSMQGFAELLLQVQNLDPQESNKLNIIRGGIDRLNLLASALGTVFHETVEPHWIKVDVHPFLEHLVADYAQDRSLPDQTIKLEGGEQDLQLVTDPELLKLALEQILDNAVEAVEKPGRGDIHVVLRQNEKEARISVTNPSKGFDAGAGSDWWVPFYTTKSGHLGLGLARVRRIVETLGGKSEVGANESGEVEVGLTLPI